MDTPLSRRYFPSVGLLLFALGTSCQAPSGSDPNAELFLAGAHGFRIGGRLVGAFHSALADGCGSPESLRLQVTSTVQPLAFTDAGRLVDVGQSELLRSGEDLTSGLTFVPNGDGLTIYHPCLEGPAWARLTLPSQLMAFTQPWNPHFVQRPGNNFRLWLTGASRPVVSGIIRHELGDPSEVFYEVVISEPTLLTRSDYARMVNLDTMGEVACALPGHFNDGPGLKCGTQYIPRMRLELRGWTGKTGVPLTRADGTAPVFDIDWTDPQGVDGSKVWHETRVPPFP